MILFRAVSPARLTRSFAFCKFRSVASQKNDRLRRRYAGDFAGCGAVPICPCCVRVVSAPHGFEPCAKRSGGFGRKTVVGAVAKERQGDDNGFPQSHFDHPQRESDRRIHSGICHGLVRGSPAGARGGLSGMYHRKHDGHNKCSTVQLSRDPDI